MQKSFIDHLGNSITINFPPKRIVSIVPSQTELLFDLGLDEEVVGVTKFCVHPIEKFASRTKVGGTKKLKLELIEQLQPDLIIGNKEENCKEDIEFLQKHFPVWMSDIYNVEDAVETICQIGSMVNRAPEADYLKHLIDAGFRDLALLAAQHNIYKRVAYLIWKDPYMAVGPQTFINNILTTIGLTNVVSVSRYPEVSLKELEVLNCQVVLLSSEPYPFKEKHLDAIKESLPNTEVMLVDGEMFSWYGSRMVKAVHYFFELQKQFV
ncbi:ABC-type Fe3+-hydroxamate transport system substrate-binding protein [Pedobacter sp. UYP30]|uniref:ABC transporter substrate-binding protein n=1 Tax=Pedobacter sp. UYP30 TaxID=1756400 RepID=UPI0033977388